MLCAALNPTAQAALFTVTSTADSGAGSLRAAIALANANADADEIRFAIMGAGPHRITSLSTLQIDESLLIDGYSQAGAIANSNTPAQGGLNGTLMIELSGTGGGTGLYFVGQLGSELTVRGLAINRFSNLVFDQGNGSVIVEGSYLGTDVTGEAVPSPVDLGVELQLTRSDRIGGLLPQHRNLISGARAGVSSAAIQAQIAANCSSVIQGNLIGTDRTGTIALGNRTGISLSLSEVPPGANGLLIGGLISAARNVISGNLRSGIAINCASTGGDFRCANGTLILGNYIGTRADGDGALGNGSESSFPGISFYQVANSSTRVQIGGTDAGASNRIAYNTRFGIDHSYLSGHGTLVIGGNQIYANGTRGIATTGRTNDAADVDAGPNRGQNFPVFVSGSQLNGQISARYAVDTAAGNASYPLTVHFYRSRNGSGDYYLGQQTYPTPQVAQDAVIPVPAGVTVGFVVALATDAAGNTSEFSEALDVDTLLADGFEDAP
jgi:hypothetical protein